MQCGEQDLQQWDGVEDEELETMCLRFSFQEQKFIKLWKILKDLNWTHRNLQYSFEGKTFSANELVEYLDSTAVSPVFGTLQNGVAVNRDPEAARLRRQVIQKWREEYPDARVGNSESTSGTNSPYQSTSGSASTATSAHRRSSPRNLYDKGSEVYFQKAALKRRKNKKSIEPCISDIETLTAPSIRECVALPLSYSMDAIEKSEQEIQRLKFAQWHFLLASNHSMLLYGVGSKQSVLHQFATQQVEGYSLEIKGYDKNATIEEIMNAIVLLYLNGKEPVETLPSCELEDRPDVPVVGESNKWRAPAKLERAISIGRAVAQRAYETLIPIYLCIHNLELLGGNDNLDHECLAALLVNSVVPNGCRSIRLLASIDQLDAPFLIGTPSVTANFHWIFEQIDTLRPYTDELLALPVKTSTKASLQRNRRYQDDRHLNVLENLAPLHAKVVQTLARLQLSSGEENGWIGYSLFRETCKSDLLILKESVVRNLMVELTDHGLIETRKDQRMEFVRIPQSNSQLREILSVAVQDKDQ